MITLITGTPGAGKTLYTVSEILGEFEGRKVFVDGIPELHLPHEEPLGPSLEWDKWLPHGGVLVIDECQRVYPVRPAGQKPPQSVSAFDTHRHNGHDIVLITQHPNNLDGHIRRLVSRHLHVRRVWGWGKAIVYEWDQTTDPNRLATATKKAWSYPKKNFSLYKSASQHNARGQKPPMVFYLLFLLPVVFGVLAYTLYQSVTAKVEPSHVTEGKPQKKGEEQEARPVTDKVESFDFVPRFASMPATAPAYDELRKVQTLPIISGCISSSVKCACYTANAAQIEIPEKDCRQRAQTIVFDPYSAPPMPSPIVPSIAANTGQPSPTTPQPEPVPATWEPSGV